MNLCHTTSPVIESKNINSPSLSFLLRKNVASTTRLICLGFMSGILTVKSSSIFLIFLVSNSKSE